MTVGKASLAYCKTLRRTSWRYWEKH